MCHLPSSVLDRIRHNLRHIADLHPRAVTDVGIAQHPVAKGTPNSDRLGSCCLCLRVTHGINGLAACLLFLPRLCATPAAAERILLDSIHLRQFHTRVCQYPTRGAVLPVLASKVTRIVEGRLIHVVTFEAKCLPVNQISNVLRVVADVKAAAECPILIPQNVHTVRASRHHFS